MDELRKHQELLAKAALESSDDEDEYDNDNQHGENGASAKPSAESSMKNISHCLKPFSVCLNRLDKMVPAAVDKIDRLSEPLICGSELPFTVIVGKILCTLYNLN